MAQAIDFSKGGPVEVTSSDGMEWRQNEQMVIARGSARAVRGDVTVTADRLTARYRRKAGTAGRRRHGQQRDLPAGGRRPRPHLHRDRPRRGRPRRL